MTDKKSRFTPFQKQCFVTCSVCLNLVGGGAALGFPGVLLPQLHDPGSPITISGNMESWITSVIAFAIFFGNFFTAPIMTRLGRRAAHFAVMVPVILGWFAFIMATNAEMLLIGRILHGIFMGMLQSLRSVLIGEYTSPKNRGGFLTTITLSQAFGIFFVHMIGSVTSFQTTAIISLFFVFASFIMTMYSPESPSWLATQGRFDECRKVFIWLRGEEEIPELERMIAAAQKQEEKQSLEVKRNGFKETIVMIKQKEFYKPIILMTALYVMVQFSGATLMAAYSVVVIKLLMGPKVNAHFWMVALDTQRIILNALAVYVINKLSRRLMMFTTLALCTLCHLAMAAYVYAKINGWISESLWLPGILLILQIVSVAMGTVPLPSVIAGEVYPLQYRSIAGSISIVPLSGSFFVVLKTFPGLISAMGLHGTYTLYSGILAACFVVVWYMLPETRGKTLQEIEEYFRGTALVSEDLESKTQKTELEPLKGADEKLVLEKPKTIED